MMPEVVVKTLPRIYVDVRDVEIVVKGQTGPRTRALGFHGLGLRWNRDRRYWYGPLTLKNLAIMDRWQDVELSREAKQALESFREAAAKREKATRRVMPRRSKVRPEPRKVHENRMKS